MFAFIGALTGLLGAAGVGIWLIADRKALAAERDRLAHELDAAQQRIEALRQENEQFSRDIAQFKQKQSDLEQQAQDVQKQFEQAQKQLRESFQNLANEALDRSSKRFVEMAKHQLEGKKTEFQNVLEQRKQAVEELVKPVRETLDKYQQNLQQMEQARQKAYGTLSQQVQQMAQDQRTLQQETRNLVQALRRPEARGRWGEMQLKRVAELAGMIEHCDFYEQSSVDSEAGRLRPDMLVQLPGERTIVVDAKTPVDAFINAVQSDDQDTQQQYMQQHVQQIETQVQQLAKKEYWSQFDRTPDFVVMFIPGESFLHAAAQRKPELMEQAMNRGVVIATPTTLISLLKVVALGWREERIAESARHISQLGQQLHERIATVTGHVEKLGKSLEQAVGHYNKFVGSFESRVLSSARKFKELGADSSKELPAEGEVQPIETNARELRGAEET
jgi:DNA recombination protein RmuC